MLGRFRIGSGMDFKNTMNAAMPLHRNFGENKWQKPTVRLTKQTMASVQQALRHVRLAVRSWVFSRTDDASRSIELSSIANLKEAGYPVSFRFYGMRCLCKSAGYHGFSFFGKAVLFGHESGEYEDTALSKTPRPWHPVFRPLFRSNGAKSQRVGLASSSGGKHTLSQPALRSSTALAEGLRDGR